MPAIRKTRPRASKHEEVISQFRQRIARGEWRPGERLPSFGQMREDYGLAPTTIDRIYAVLEQEGLVVREQGRGIFLAEPSVSAAKRTVGFMGPVDQELRFYPYWVHLLEGIQDAAREANFDVMLLQPEAPSWEKLDGLLLHGESSEVALLNRPEIMPAVALMMPCAEVPSVVADDANGTRQAVEYLLGLGHTRIACLMLTDTPLPKRRLHGYLDRLLEAGITPVPEWVRALTFPPEDVTLRNLGRWNMERWLADGWQELGCTALLVQNDRMALGVLDAFRVAGIDVPGEVSVVGFDGTEECEDAIPSLTSVEVPLRRIGAAGMKSLLRQIDGERGEPDTLVLPARLQVRGSTGPARDT